jgi:PhnB protein
MAGKVNPIPEGYHSITPYLMVKGAAEALDFYVKAFDAEVVVRMDGPDDTVSHAEVRIGDSRFMLGEDVPENPDVVCSNPKRLGGSSIGLMVYLADVDKAIQRAVDAGAEIRRPLQDQFYGDRSGTVEDPFGHFWTLASHIEDVAPEEMERRMAELQKT